MASTAPRGAWTKGSGPIFNRLSTTNSRSQPKIDESDSSDSDSDGGVLVEADVTGSHAPIITRHRKQSKFEAAQEKKSKGNTQEASTIAPVAKSAVSTSAVELEVPISTMTVKDTRDTAGEDKMTDEFSAFPSIRRKPQSGAQRVLAPTKMGGRISWWTEDDESSKRLPASPAVSQEGSKAVQPPSFSDVLKQSTGTKDAGAGPSKNDLLSPHSSSSTASRSSKQILPRFTGAKARHEPSVLRPRALTGATSVSSSGSTPAAATNKAREILRLPNWRANSKPVATASSEVLPSAPTAAPLSYAKVASSSTAVVSLPRRDTEAERVKKEMSRYRQYHGLTEESRFTRMIKVEAEQTGAPRPKPVISNVVSESESTAVYLKGLPGDTTYYDLLKNIHCGQIWHTYIDHPNPPKQLTSAAKVAFLTHAQAETFMDDIESGRYTVRGELVTNAIWDRRSEPERPNVIESRCIQIQGPASMMEWAWFEREFTDKMDLKITEFFEVVCKDPTSKIFQINFAGIFAQSRAVVKALEKDFGDIYSFRYVPDPCNDGAY